MRRKALLLISMGCLAVLLPACAGNIILNPDYRPEAKSKAPLASVPSLKVRLLDFEDKRSETMVSNLIGRRDAAFEVPMGDVLSERPVSEIMRDAVANELMGNGHTIVTHNEDVSIRGKVLKFWVGTDVTTTYWDVVGQVSFEIEVTHPGRAPVSLGPYSGRNVERTYINPSEAIVRRMLMKSLGDAMQSMSSDPGFVKALSAE